MRCLSGLGRPPDAAPGQERRWRGYVLASILVVFCILLITLSTPTAFADNPTFTARRYFGTGEDEITAMVMGDVNGDGALDLIAASNKQNVVYLNDGAGNFVTGALNCTVVSNVRCFGTRAESVVVGDINGDGSLDLVAVNYQYQSNSYQTVIYLNNGAGNFHIGPITCGVTARVRCLSTGVAATAVGDLNGDGALDIVTNHPTNNRSEIVTYLNDSAGNFYSGPVACNGNIRLHCFGTKAGYTSISAIGDVNRDGALDLVGIYTDYDNNINEGLAYLNDGMGNFYDGRITCGVIASIRCFGDKIGRESSYIAVGDMNGDNALDMIVAKMAIMGGEFVEGRQSVVYLNDGRGNFETKPTDCDDPQSRMRCFGTAEDATERVAVGDLNGDGALDLVGSAAVSGYANESQGPQSIYLNDGAGNFQAGRVFDRRSSRTAATALGDVNGDGALDIVSGYFYEENTIYMNDGAGSVASESITCGRTVGVRCFGTQSYSVAAGDMNGDGALDIVADDTIYLNNGAGNFYMGPLNCAATDRVRCLPNFPDRYPSALAIGDVDSNGALDIAVIGSGQGQIYLNQGTGVFATARRFGPPDDYARSVALGDINSDGSLDLIVGQYGGPFFQGGQSAVYLNDGAGNFSTGPINCGDIARVRCFGPDQSYFPQRIAVGDMNSDGALDIVAGSISKKIQTGPNSYFITPQNIIYLNDGTSNFHTGPVSCGITARAYCFGEGSRIQGLAVGDMNGDGALDVVDGNGKQSAVYLNDGAAHFYSGSAICNNAASVRCFGEADDDTSAVAVADINGDGALDVIAGNNQQANAIYPNDGAGNFHARRTFGTQSNYTLGVAVGDVDGDGALDLIFADSPKNVVYLNGLTRAGRLANNPPQVTITRPGPTRSAPFYSTPAILSSRTIPITYRLSDPEGDRVRFIHAFYSADGGGRWLPAVAAAGTITTNLTTNANHVYNWDTFASGFYGQSDNVVFRIEAYPGLGARINQSPAPAPGSKKVFLPFVFENQPRFSGSIPGPYQRPYLAAQTFPFRVRGTQVRVQRGTTPAAGALVYRLPAGQPRGAKPFADRAGMPFRTDAHGYLPGRGALNIDDQLVALLPITSTDTYRLYYTNATPTPTGLSTFKVTTPGVQTLTVSSAHPLVLFNLVVSLEWDARRDSQFLSQLQFDLRRASELLYDWTNGQAALAQVTIYHDRQRWVDADIRVYASNRMRPNAAQGGIVSRLIHDPQAPSVTYQPGQVRVGAIWNRYGESNGSLGEDWPRALAHELGHYALYLDDDYLGLDANGLLVPVDTCIGTAMSDPYREDYSEFHRAGDWLPSCQNTLANRSTGRSDWSTIVMFYPWLSGAGVNPGPSGLPLEVTQVQTANPITPTNTLEVPTFYLSQNGGIVQPGPSARAFLFHGDRITDLGRPTLDQVLARGARPGDRVCVYELGIQIPRLGCETISEGDDQLTLTNVPGWQPEVIVAPSSAQAITIRVKGLPAGLSLKARLYPANDRATSMIALPRAADMYTGAFNLAAPALEGYLHVWVEEGGARREIVTDYSLGGDPARIRGNYAPAISSDGQVILFAEHLTFQQGEFLTLQAATSLPAAPSWANLVGQGYWLSASAHAPSLTSASISFSYLGREVPPGEEQWLKVYFWNGASWRPLTTTLDLYHNVASARAEGPGLYALMTSVEIPLYGPGWNLVAYPVQATRPVTEALRSIDGYYTTVYGYVITDTADPWKVYDVGAPAWANDLPELKFGQGYWITVTQDITLRLQSNPSMLATSTPAAALQNPPATYYGAVQASPGFTPAAGMVVVARINGVACGNGKTLSVGGQVVYAVNVLADGPGGAAGCGAPERPIAFQVGPHVMQTTTAWNNDRVWAVQLN